MTDSELERLSFGQVIEMNESLCAETGENSALLDAGGLSAALERPWSGFGDEEFFPTLYDKAAALLHGIASRQVFENGNKRTAWVAAVTLLDLNGIDLGLVETVHADMFVRAAGLDHSLAIGDLAEWFRITHRQHRAGYAFDPRIEYLVLASGSELGESGNLHMVGGHLATVAVGALPTPLGLHLLTRIHWREEDAGRSHILRVIYSDTPEDWDVQEFPMELAPPMPVSGHLHHRFGMMPLIVRVPMVLYLEQDGLQEFVVELDGVEVGRLPLKVDRIG